MKNKYILLYTLIMLACSTVWGRDVQPLVIMGDSAYPPFEFINKHGHPDGFNIELTRAVMEKAQLPYVIRLTGWESAKNSLDENEADILSGMLYSDKRSDKYRFSTEHSVLHYQVVCRKDDLHPSKLSDLKGKRIIVPKAELIVDILKDAGCGQHIIESDNIKECMMHFYQSDADCMIMPASLARMLIYTNSIDNIDMVDIGIPKLNSCFVTKDANLTKKLNRALVQLKDDGTYQRIQNKWFYPDAEPEYRQNVIFIIVISGILIVVVVVVTCISRKKIKEDRDRELKGMVENMKFAIKTAEMSMWEYDCATETAAVFNEPMINNEQPVNIDYIKKVVHEDDFNGADMSSAFDIMQMGINSPFQFDVRVKVPYEKDWQYCTVKGRPSKYDDAGKVTKYLCIRVNNTKHMKLQQILLEQKEKAERSDKLKSAFLANMSHEIRTPLNAIIGFSSLLQQTDNPHEREQYMDIVNRNNEQLLGLINDILDLSKIESGFIEMKNEWFDMTALFNEAFTIFRQRCTNPDIEMRIEVPYSVCMVDLDRSRIWQLLGNFLTNALKYTVEGYIKMGYKCVDGGVRIYVEDTGIGIPADKQTLAFRRFAKLDTFAQGTGLGLAICKAIVDAKHGRIGVNSIEGEGSTFWAWVPCEVNL